MNPKSDNQIMSILKVTQIRYLIADTDKGQFCKVLRKGEDKYHYTLDSVVLDDETVAELKKVFASLAPKETPKVTANKVTKKGKK